MHFPKESPWPWGRFCAAIDLMLTAGNNWSLLLLLPVAFLAGIAKTGGRVGQRNS